ncbi:hypothetical protein, partial [Klebsiella pneumoniae]|uniref:hypothetical protein n=1 Tax=Klebsiella pneumoniae TaxID=573 RepID=UPI003B9853DC
PAHRGWSAVAALTAVQVGDAAAAHDHLTRWSATRAGSPSRTFDRAGLCLAAAAAFSLRDRGVAQMVREALPVDRHAVPV